MAKVSHELRTPLGAILGFAEMIQVGVYGEISEQQHEATGKIIESTTYLSSMVNELLDQAQLEARQLILVVDEFDPRDVTNTVQSRMQILAKHKGISLITQVTPSLTSCVYGDEKRIQQILINLVSNAIKFTETGTVKVHCYQPDAFHWAFQVSDTGIGIPTEAQRRIFEPFGQVDGSETREQMGTGLGLSIVQQLTSLMGGQITLKSQVDRGSTFTVTLPIQAKQSLRSDVQNDD
ncbi:MAG: HAMP domain-containing sensor histidine kinase [Chloroflexota bacterium]